MGIFTTLIEKMRRKSVAIFVDFEHWCYSMENLFGMRPDVVSFFTDVSKKYKIKRVYFFGDFKLHPDAELIEKAIRDAGLVPISLSHAPLVDLGGAVVIE